jgi:hypothetical protein
VTLCRRSEQSELVPVTDEMVERAAKALFARGYMPSQRRADAVDEHWPQVTAAVRDAYLREARRLLVAAHGGPYA